MTRGQNMLTRSPEGTQKPVSVLAMPISGSKLRRGLNWRGTRNTKSFRSSGFKNIWDSCPKTKQQFSSSTTFVCVCVMFPGLAQWRWTLFNQTVYAISPALLKKKEKIATHRVRHGVIPTFPHKSFFISLSHLLSLFRSRALFSLLHCLRDE